MREGRAPATSLPGRIAAAVDHELRLSETLRDHPDMRQPSLKLQLRGQDIDKLKAIRAFDALEQHGFIEHKKNEIYLTGLTTLSEAAARHQRTNERGAST